MGQLLRYGPTIPEHTPSGQLFLVTPAPALSPLVFQSNRHRPQLRPETGQAAGARHCLLRAGQGELSVAQRSEIAALLHDRMMEVVFAEMNEAAALFAHHEPRPLPR